MTIEPTRRQFLAGAAAGLAGLAVGCGGSDDDSSATGTTGAGGDGPSTTAAPAPSTTRPAPDLTGDPFTLGVASGDPHTDSVVLWTRLAVDPVALDGRGAMPDDAVDVRCEVADDDAFTTNVRQLVATAEPAHGHSVHLVVDGLDPATEYHYRFVVGDFTSPAGRTRTLPDGSPERFGVAVVNCQWFEVGAYAAYRHLLDEPVDLVMHLGDYIYEFPGGTEGRTTLPANNLVTLADYRVRYASYRLDEDLRNAHARFPFVLTWDDHEVENNYMGDVLEDGGGSAVERKAAAYQAWWENQPTRLDPPEGSVLDVQQSLDVGDLARIYLLDERQFSDVPPCRGVPGAEGDFGDCEARTAEDRTRLGAAQEAWLADEAGRGGVTWNLLGNPVVLAGVDGGNEADGSKYYLDTWDGFPTARGRLIDLLATVENPVVLTGDYHAGMVLDVAAEPFVAGSPVVAPEFMAPPISSILFSDDVSARTPQLRQQLNNHGYLTVEVTPSLLTATFRCLADVADPASAISTGATWTVTPGNPVAQPA